MSYGSTGAFSGYSPVNGSLKRPSVWTPENLPYLARYSADTAALSFANGASVTSLPSSGGPGPTLGQVDISSDVPIMVSADPAFGNRPTLNFGVGTNTCLGSIVQPQPILNHTDLCFLFVGKPSAQYRQTFMGTDNTEGPQFEIQGQHPSSIALIFPGSFYTNVYCFDSPVLHECFIFALQVNPTTATTSGSADGYSETSSVHGTATFSANRRLVIGRRGHSNQLFRGKFADLTLVRGLSFSDRQKYEGWAAHYYGLTARLPSGHPYKAAPPYV